jgi:hypothetical protein
VRKINTLHSKFPSDIAEIIFLGKYDFSKFSQNMNLFQQIFRHILKVILGKLLKFRLHQNKILEKIILDNFKLLNIIQERNIMKETSA